MIKLRGDTHGFYNEFLDIDKHMDEGDICIICGDAGLIFHDNENERHFLDELANKPYSIAFIDGNHENFSALYSYPEETWNGGRIHRIRKNIIHLCRGQVFNIEGKKFFTFGGGYSLDCARRIPGRSWWPEEMPSQKEYDEGKRNLEKNQWKVDYIITHSINIQTIPVLACMDRYNEIKSCVPEEMPLNYYLEDIRETTEYKKWFFGHFHRDIEIAYTRQVALFNEFYIEI